MLALESTEQVAFYRSCRAQAPAHTKFVRILRVEDGGLARVDAMNLDGVVHRPVADADLKATVSHLLAARQAAGVC